MRKLYTLLFLLSFSNLSLGQGDTLIMQTFDSISPYPVWNYTGVPAAINCNGFTGATESPANSEIGIGGSCAWEVVSVGGGNTLEFDNFVNPGGYDSLTFQCNISGVGPGGTGQGPDHLDYVLFEVSTDGGTNYYNRVRVRGAVANNSQWSYQALGVGQVSYLPATEALFQPQNSGLQEVEGIARVIISFPSTVTDIRMRVTPRSSAGGDVWHVDNVRIIGHTSCLVDADFTPSQDTVCTGTTINFTNGSSNATGYNWYLDGQFQSTNTNESILFSTPGTYDVSLVADDGSGTCSDSTAQTIVVYDCTDIPEWEQNNFNIYPNPAHENLTIKALNQINQVDILDVQGRVLNSFQQNGSTTLDVSHLSPGVYLIRLNNDPLQTKRLIIQR